MNRFIFTGDREWTDVESVRYFLERLKEAYGSDVKIVHGAARGLDSIVGRLATDIFGEANVEKYPADWSKYGHAAGPIRNRFMLTESIRKSNIDGYVVRGGVVFHDDLKKSKGTKDMVDLMESKKYGFKVLKLTSQYGKLQTM